jgi:ABC-type branched-subunit amino acid transport system substrate-binding protein
MWFVVLALVAVGCGTRVPDQTVAGGQGQGQGQSQGQGTGTGAGSGTGTGSGGGTAAAGATFGTLANPCGPSTAGANTASDKGVTATEINVSTIADPGGVKPGLNQGIHDSMRAFADWCNGFGGINGRKLIVDLKDAKLSQYKDRVVEACQDSFALVGGLGVFDQAGTQDAVDCGLPNVPAAALSPEATEADYTVQPLPNPIKTYQVGSGRWVKDTFPGTAERASTLYSKVPMLEAQSNRLVEAYETIGYKFIYRQSANISETNWAPLVVAMKNQDVKYMTLTSSFEEIIPLQKEMATQNYRPEVTELETNFYNTKYPELAKEQGADTTNTFVRLPIWPFEEADQNPAMSSYLSILKKSVPEAQPEELGVQAFSAGLLFATAAKAAGPQLTRANLVTELKKVHEWSGGGLHGQSDPGGNKATSCFLMMKVDSQSDKPGFKRYFPLPDKNKEIYDKGKGWSCPDDATIPLKSDFGQGAKAKGK